MRWRDFVSGRLFTYGFSGKVQSFYQKSAETTTLFVERSNLGCPLVAASVGGIPEVIDDHANGLLHCAGSSDDLAAQIISLLNDPKRAAQLGKQAAIDSQGRLSPETVAGGQWIVMARLSSESDRGNEQAVRFSCRFRAASAKIRLGFRVYGLWNQLFGMIGPYKTLA